MHSVTYWVLRVTYRQGLDWMIGFIDTLYTPLEATGNYSAIAIPTIYRSLLHTLVSSVSVRLSACGSLDV
jgi:hypothetical protein